MPPIRLFAMLVCLGTLAAEEPAGPRWDLQTLGAAPPTWPAESFAAEGMRALFYQGVPFKGAPTRVFAWIGLPQVPAGTRVPAMVLIHGGGGTAFDTWVRRWTSRGYAAIAMDTCGALPRKTADGKFWVRNPQGGPGGWGGFGQIDQPAGDQWAYHAVSAAILAHSLIRSLPEVDPERTGVCGISWGGYLTCLTAANDPRFKLAIPVYGCGFTTEHTFAKQVIDLGPDRAARWMRWWDPSSYLARTTMPMCWVTGSNDFAYTLNALQKSYRLPTGPRTLAIRLRMPHGHGDAGEAPTEIFAFADSVLKGGAPLARITGQGSSDGAARATVSSRQPLVRAELNWTCDRGPWPQRAWQSQMVAIDGAGRISAQLPSGATVWYFNVFDDRGCVVSSEHESVPER